MISSAGLNERCSRSGGFGGAGWKGWFRSDGAIRAANGAVGTRRAGWGGPLPDPCRLVFGAHCQPSNITRGGAAGVRRASGVEQDISLDLANHPIPVDAALKEATVDNPGPDAQDPQANGSEPESAPPDRSNGSGGDKDPLLQLLQGLNKEQGNNKTAKRLGVDRKTVWRALDAGRLTPRLRDALEREQKAAKLAAQREETGGDQLELRVEGMARRLQDVEEQLATGLTGLRGELSRLRDEVKTLAWTRPEFAGAGTGSDAASTGSTASTSRSPYRTYPQVVTVDALPDDEQVFGEAMPLVAEWREQRALFKAHWPSLEGLEAEVRMLELELELIEELRLTLPPGKLPWEWDQCRREVRRREQRLRTARRNLRRAHWRRRLLLLVGVGWRRSAME